MKNGSKILISGGTSALFTLCCAAHAYAADIIENAGSMIGTYFSKIRGIAIGAGLLASLVAIIVMTVHPDDRAAQEGKRWLTRIFLGIVILLSLGGILSLIQNLTQGQGLDIDKAMGI